MIVYHVTTYKKLNKYIKNGNKIKAPVRAEQAERMSKSTGRKLILRLNAEKLEGHFNQARVIN